MTREVTQSETRQEKTVDLDRYPVEVLEAVLQILQAKQEKQE